MRKSEKITDSGIFERHSLSCSIDEDEQTFWDLCEKASNLFNYQYDIKARLLNIESRACKALEEEGYKNISHLHDIDRQLLSTKNEGEVLSDVIDRMAPKARRARSILYKLCEIEGQDLGGHPTVLLDLGKLSLMLELSYKVEPKFKKHKDAPVAGGKSRASKYDKLKRDITDINSTLDPNMNREKRAQIIFSKIQNKIYDDIEVTENKIYQHLRTIEKKS